MLKVAFDIGGVISRYPKQMKDLIWTLQQSGAEVYVISDMHPREQIMKVLIDNALGWIPANNVYSADYREHGDQCKAKLVEELGIDIFIDDHPGYMSTNCISLFVWPNPEMPYFADEWISDPTTGNFGRRPLASLRLRGMVGKCTFCGWEDYKDQFEGIADEPEGMCLDRDACNKRMNEAMRRAR